MLHSKKIDDVIEVICKKGCQAVRDDMASLKHGHKLAETDGLKRKERKAVYKELKSIMAVYGDVCRVDGEVSAETPKQRQLINDYFLHAFPGN